MDQLGRLYKVLCSSFSFVSFSLQNWLSPDIEYLLVCLVKIFSHAVENRLQMAVLEVHARAASGLDCTTNSPLMEKLTCEGEGPITKH